MPAFIGSDTGANLPKIFCLFRKGTAQLIYNYIDVYS